MGNEKVRLSPLGNEKVRLSQLGNEKVRLSLLGNEKVKRKLETKAYRTSEIILIRRIFLKPEFTCREKIEI